MRKKLARSRIQWIAIMVLLSCALMIEAAPADPTAPADPKVSADLTVPVEPKVGTILFAEDFESGDLGNWSLVQPIPEVNILAPLSLIYLPSEIRVDYSQADPRVIPSSVEIRVDGEVLTSTCDRGPKKTVCTPPDLEFGQHQLIVRFQTEGGRPGFVGRFFDFRLDDVKPLLSINSPREAELYDPRSVIVAMEFDDGESGLDLGTLNVEFDGEAIDLDAPNCERDVDFVRCEISPVEMGTHTVSASITDLAGNGQADEIDFDLLRDVTPPNLTILQPATTQLINPIDLTLEIAYDDDLAGVDLDTVQLFLDGEDLTVFCGPDGNGRSSCAVEVPAPGAHLFRATAMDLAGNPVTVERAFDVVEDLDPPEIVVTSHTDGEVVNSALVTLEGTLNDEHGITEVKIDGLTEAILDADGFSVEVPLEEGLNVFSISATNAVGVIGSVSLRLERLDDSIEPALAILSPSPAAFTDGQPPIALRFDDENNVDPDSLVLLVGGDVLDADCELSLLGGRCTLNEPLADGLTTLIATIEDVFGNQANAAVTFEVDTVGVEVAISEPLADTILTEDQILVRGTVGAEVDEVTVNGVAANLQGMSFEATVPVREGRNMLVALATKSNGNTATSSQRVIRDIASPIVRITTPRDGFRSVESAITVAGQFNDTVITEPTQVMVNGLPAQASSGAFLLPDLPLLPGDNAIEVVVIDGAGNEGRHSIQIHFEEVLGPRLVKISGDGQLGTVDEALPAPLVVEVQDAFGLPMPGKMVQFEVSRNSGVLRTAPEDEPWRSVAAVTDNTGRASVDLTLGHTDGEGNHRVRVTAPGVIGEVEFCASAQPGVPSNILMVGGENQRGATGQPLAEPLEAKLVDALGNPVVGAPVTFTVIDGGGALDGETSWVGLTDIEGVARTVLTLGRAPGRYNNVVTAIFDGITTLDASFAASAFAPGDPAETRFRGVVLDNAYQAIPGAEVAIGEVIDFTDERGYFELIGIAPGRVDLYIDPTNSPRPEVFPPLHFETIAIAGQVNELELPISLPALDLQNSAVVGGDEDVVLQMAGIEGVELTVFANSVTFPDGSKVGEISISQVQLDKVPMAPPNGSFFMPPAWTIQPHGVAFDPPARIQIPNDGLEPGRVIDIFQFDHTLNQFIDVGRGSISADGALIASDLGFGIQRAGWGGCGQPPPPRTCTESCDDMNQCTTDRCVSGNCRNEPRSGSCDDMKFCTNPDMCERGKCAGKKKPDKNGPAVSSSFDLGQKFEPVKNILRRVFGEEDAPDLELMIGFEGSSKLKCCEEKMMDDMAEITGKGSGMASIKLAEVPLGTGFRLPFNLGRGGLLGTANGGFGGSVDIALYDRCTDKADGSAALDASLSVSVSFGGEKKSAGPVVELPGADESPPVAKPTNPQPRPKIELVPEMPVEWVEEAFAKESAAPLPAVQLPAEVGAIEPKKTKKFTAKVVGATGIKGEGKGMLEGLVIMGDLTASWEGLKITVIVELFDGTINIMQGIEIFAPQTSMRPFQIDASFLLQ